MKLIRIGTRPSKLALAQTELVIENLKKHFPELTAEIIVIKTTGDNKQDLGNNVARDKRDWIEEIEQAILEDRIDLAVHSGKDVPYDISAETNLHSVLERADPRDIFIGKPNTFNKKRIELTNVAKNSLIGTSSLRRKAQLRIFNPDLESCEIRGNVPTRISKLETDQKLSGIILAAAGLERLNISRESFEILSIDKFLPASAQGTLTVQYKKSHVKVSEYARKIIDWDTEAALIAERAAILSLGADCRSAVAVYAKVENVTLKVIGRIFSNRDLRFIEASVEGPAARANDLGTTLAEELLSKGAKEILAEH